jgi:hypothetical protein
LKGVEIITSSIVKTDSCKKISNVMFFELKSIVFVWLSKPINEKEILIFPFGRFLKEYFPSLSVMVPL